MISVLSLTVLVSGLLGVPEGELKGGALGLDLATGWTLTVLAPQLHVKPACAIVHSDPDWCLHIQSSRVSPCGKGQVLTGLTWARWMALSQTWPQRP